MSREKYDSRNLHGDRIRILRKALSLTQSEFAKSIGISSSYLSEIEANKCQPSKIIYIAIELRWSINSDWLLTGEGEMFREEARESEIIGVSEEEREILEALREVPEMRPVVLKLLRSGKNLKEALAEAQEIMAGMTPGKPGYEVRETPPRYGADVEDED